MDDIAKVNPGIIGGFLKELPEMLFHLGLRVGLSFLVFLMGTQLIKLAGRILKKALARARVDEGAVKFIDSFVRYGLYFLLLITIASWLGVDAASILALLGSVSVAIGLAVQGSLSNLAGGMLLLILKPFSVGDYVRDGLGNEGTVTAVDVFYTQLTTPDNKIIVLPNGALANGCITNFTKCRMRRIDISVSIAYQADIAQAKEVLFRVLEQEEGILPEEEKRVFVEQLGDSGIVLTVRGWTLNENFWESKWRLTEKIKYALDEAGIIIPFPQMDVHLDRAADAAQ